MELTKEQIAVMAVAAIAEETGSDPKHVRIVSFKERKKTGLEQYLEDHGISYQKYELGAKRV